MDKKYIKNFRKTHPGGISATLFVILIIAAVLILSYFSIFSIIRDRSVGRMEDNVNTVIQEISSKLQNDSDILRTAANIISHNESFSEEALTETLRSIDPLFETMRLNILLPGDRVISSQADGIKLIDGSGIISFEDEAALGEHVSDRMYSLIYGNTLVYRHYVPIFSGDRTMAVLYGATILEDLPAILSTENIYGSQADVFIIDTATGDYIMDTKRDSLGNIRDNQSIEIKDEDGLEKILSGDTGYLYMRSDARGKWGYLYYAPAGINAWTITVYVPEDVAMAGAYTVRRICIIAGMILAVTVLIYYIWVRKQYAKFTEQTVEHALLEEKFRKAEAAEKAKTMFLSNMSHDIRTPMNAIIGFATLAETNIDNKEKVSDYIGKILSSRNHLLSLINDILDMSRIESGRLNIEEKPCSISEIFKDMRNIIQTQMASKQLNFFMDTVDIVNEDIYCDKLHINQILLNLLSNAIKFTPAGGTVCLKIRQKMNAPTGYGAYELSVKDTGVGMSKEFSEHVFEPFERERTSTVSGVQGTGLGMAITKNIVDAMGGTIECKTEQGKGTEFIINLEFRLCENSEAVGVIDELKGLRALVVDDDFEVCDSVTKMLRQLGMQSEWTLRGKEAVLHAKHACEVGSEFRAYIIDWSLPDLNGIEVARQIRELSGGNIPIIVLTAYDWKPFEEEARAAGVTGFCNKPIFLSELRDALVGALNTGLSEEPAQKKNPIAEHSGEFSGRRVLLVEDNELNREIAEEIFREAGLEVDSAEDGKQAVEIVKSSEPGRYGLVFMDIQMPVMNGIDAAKEIRKLDDPALSQVPIIAMTANAFDEDVKTATDAGMNGFLAKPINVPKLMETLKDWLGDEKDK